MVMEPKNYAEEVIEYPNHYLRIWLHAWGYAIYTVVLVGTKT